MDKIENKILVLDDGDSILDFYSICEKADEKEIDFNAVLMSEDAYLSIYQFMLINGWIVSLETGEEGVNIEPFDENGEAVIQFLTNTVTSEKIKVYVANTKSILN